MRKLKSKRIGDYLLKGLLLCALVVGGWFTTDIGVKRNLLRTQWNLNLQDHK